MATRFRAAARIVGQSAVSVKALTPGKREGGSVADMVDTIRKHKKFKQLVTYSLQCLEKVICPPSFGWEVRDLSFLEFSTWLSLNLLLFDVAKH